MKIDIIYEDNHILVVKKPINILSQSDRTEDNDMLSLLKKDIKKRHKKPGNVYLGLVHRLDRPAGGLMVFAKTSKAAGRLSENIRNRTFKKHI
jgi:23S rRNA pseudouridine1911/1915/1917 synthase